MLPEPGRERGEGRGGRGGGRGNERDKENAHIILAMGLVKSRGANEGYIYINRN